MLDVCCGMGRHATELSARGYSVVAVDRDQKAITAARALDSRPDYICADVREYQPQVKTFDAAIVMGQSFGHFDEPTNHSILLSLAKSIREGGRVILDLWNPGFFAANQGERELKTVRGNVREDKRVRGGRLLVDLDYPDGSREKFEWQLFTPEQMKSLAEAAGLAVIVTCSSFDSKIFPGSDEPRIQFVLERKT